MTHLSRVNVHDGWEPCTGASSTASLRAMVAAAEGGLEREYQLFVTGTCGRAPQVVSSVELVASSQAADFLSREGAVFYRDLGDAIRFNQQGQFIVGHNSRRVSTAGGELITKLAFGRVRPCAAVSVTRRSTAGPDVPRRRARH